MFPLGFPKGPDFFLGGVLYFSRLFQKINSRDVWEKHGKTGTLGQDRLEVRWEAVMFLFNVVSLNV